jgi:5-methylcytosine-specific restriction endonuclease McrA
MAKWSENPRITPKDRGLIKGAIRRAFSRSELRKQALERSRVEYAAHERPRVKKWSKCPLCHRFIPTYLMVVDHILPIIDIISSFEDQSLDETVGRTWCPLDNLQAICEECHDTKTKGEKEARKAHKNSLTKDTDSAKLKTRRKPKETK